MLANNFKKSLLAVNVSIALGAGFSGVVVAEESQNQVQENVEVIEVRGLRASNKENINTKRFATAVVDAVSAEDIGKFPDSDVGQALGRIPGISVGRAFGQGSSVSIRGTDPSMTLTTLNGQNVASTGWYDQMNLDRSFNYSMLPSQLIGGIEVYKATQANLVEGGIGGTVIVKTRKPLDLESNTSFLSLKGEYGTLNEEISPEVSGLYSWKNKDETFGVLVAAAYIDREYLRQGTEADLDWGGNSSVQPSSFLQDQERTAIDVTLQYRPTEKLELGIHALSLELGADSTGANMYFGTDNNWGAWTPEESVCKTYNAAGVCTYSDTPKDRGSNVFFQNWARQGEMTSDTLEFNWKYQSDTYEISGVLGHSKAEGGTDMSANFGFGWWGNAYVDGNGLKQTSDANFDQVNWWGVVDATGKQIKLDGADLGFTVEQLPAYGTTSTWTGIKGPNKDEEVYGQVDFDYYVDFGAINKLEFGVRYTEHEFEKKLYTAVYDQSKITAPADGENAGGFANYFSVQDLYSGTMPIGYDGWTIPRANRDAMINATLSLIDQFAYNRSGYGKIEEDNLSLYAMASFEGEGFRGNFGLRYVSTDVTSKGHIIDNSPADILANNNGWSEAPVGVDGDYNDVLPSANITFDLSEDLILRVSAGQAITRPNYDNLLLSKVTGYPDDRIGNEEITYGNPDLKPMKSSQADVSLEYYYGEDGLFAVTYFIKDVSNFIVATTDFNQQIGVINNDLTTPADDWTVNRYKNAGGGEIDGVEFQWNHAWDNGFGINANYTYTDAGAPAEVYTDNLSRFTESSEHMLNLVGYWENDEFSARAAYNWRSEYMIREYGNYYGNRMHDDFGTLDLTFGWQVTDYAALTFEVVNVTEEDDVQYGAAEVGADVKPALQDGFPTWSFRGEATYRLGVNFNF